MTVKAFFVAFFAVCAAYGLLFTVLFVIILSQALVHGPAPIAVLAAVVAVVCAGLTVWALWQAVALWRLQPPKSDDSV
jgi:hypothetical protein